MKLYRVYCVSIETASIGSDSRTETRVVHIWGIFLNVLDKSEFFKAQRFFIILPDKCPRYYQFHGCISHG